MASRRTTALRRPLLLFVAVALVVAVVTTGCGIFEGIGDDPEPDPPCECPETEQIVLTVNWLGDSSAPDSFYWWGVGPNGEEVPAVDVGFTDFTGPDHFSAAVDALFQRLEDAGLSLEHINESNTTLVLDDAGVSFTHQVVDADLSSISIHLTLAVADQRAAEVLAPVVNALGTID